MRREPTRLQRPHRPRRRCCVAWPRRCSAAAARPARDVTLAVLFPLCIIVCELGPARLGPAPGDATRCDVQI
ncbi:unnamed protein product [Danaus chrysippus]|uniref:(African queen) hypothetical protein n=1 Tax=Danaus chrysippus TaxID=151541 RepID=A0A8J2QTD9_9NEOP|nr:unnamed protein product [Danaus chrysippus]